MLLAAFSNVFSLINNIAGGQTIKRSEKTDRRDLTCHVFDDRVGYCRPIDII